MLMNVYKLEKDILYLNTIEMSKMHISFDKFLVCYEDVYMKCGREGTFDWTWCPQ